MVSDDQLLATLKAATERMFEHRRELRRVETWLRLWPEGLVLSCNIPVGDGEKHVPASMRTITWDELATLTPAGAVRIVDEVVAPAREKLLGGDGAIVPFKRPGHG